tara:strand:+ start:745 stop:1818 length:1074 start_codon:yes stop_codon:yes gene_type:complete
MTPRVAKKLNIAVIGAGFISDYHVAGLKAAGATNISVLVGRSPEKTRKRADVLGIPKTSTDYHAVLADPAIDAVVIATPDATHHQMALDALQAGKATLLQKPMAMNSNECRDILAMTKTVAVPLTVSFMHRYFPEIRWLKSLLASGALGAIHSIRIRNATPGADWADWFYSPDNVAGGVVMQLGVHGIDLVQHIAGPIATVSAAMATHRPERVLEGGRRIRTTLEDNAVARYALQSGALVSHEMSYTEIAGCDRFRLELYADKGTVWLRTERGAAAIFAPEVTGQDGWVTPPEVAEEPLGQAHHFHWISVAAGQMPVDDTAKAGLSSIQVAETIYNAAKSGSTVTVPPTPQHRETGQ